MKKEIYYRLKSRDGLTSELNKLPDLCHRRSIVTLLRPKLLAIANWDDIGNGDLVETREYRVKSIAYAEIWEMEEQ